MITQLRLGLLVAAMTLSAARPGMAEAQEQKDERKDEHSCDRAERILRLGHPDRKEAWAFALIVTCRNGASALASAWSPPPDDSAGLADLVNSSARLSDRRILDAAISAFNNATQAQWKRRLIVRTVLAQYAADLALTTSAWSDPENAGMGHYTDHSQANGEVPVTAVDRQRILAMFSAAAASDPDLLMRKVAAMIVRELSP